MAWESRGGDRYFYRAEKVDGRVVKTYVGRGLVGRIAERKVEEGRRRRLEAAAAFKAEQTRLITPERALAQHEAACKLMLEVNLRLAGYHRVDHKWRKRRVRES